MSVLAALLENDLATLPPRLPDGACVAKLAPAVWAITPEREGAGRALVLSAAIHGDETAPVEMLVALIERLVAGEIVLRVPLLIAFGNLAALRAGVRYIDVDLNRLFANAAGDAHEASRARELIDAYGRFAACHRAPLHFDLHSAIRVSYFERFAIFPNAAEAAPAAEQMARLAACGIEAVLIGPDSAPTFAAFSARSFGGESYTLELGRVRELGGGLSGEFATVAASLVALMTDAALPAVDAVPQVFRITREIVKQSDAFRLALPEDAPNFSPLAAGALVAEDAATRWFAEAGECIVFPNPAVRIGLRAGLLVRPA